MSDFVAKEALLVDGPGDFDFDFVFLDSDFSALSAFFFFFFSLSTFFFLSLVLAVFSTLPVPFSVPKIQLKFRQIVSKKKSSFVRPSNQMPFSTKNLTFAKRP